MATPGQKGRLDMDEKPLRVCYFGTYRAQYSRNRIMIEGLRRSGASVAECHVPLWHGIEDRVHVASGGLWRPAFLARVLRAYWNLWAQYREVEDYDVMVLGYPGHVDVPLARALATLRRKPLVLDLFMSSYLIAQERGITKRHPLTARLMLLAEKWAYRLPNLLIKDTPEYVDWCERVFGLEPSRFRLVPTGADDQARIPHPREADRGSAFRVLYYGTFIPNHGLPYIMEAARLLRDVPGLRFEFVGDGPLKPDVAAMTAEYGLDNVFIEGWMDRADLVERIAGADLCLGAFGLTPQSLMTVHNKVFEAMAVGQCVVSGDSPAMRTAFAHGQHVWLCDRSNPESLAAAIMGLKDDPGLRLAIARQGHALFTERYSPGALGRTFRQHLEELIGPSELTGVRASQQSNGAVPDRNADMPAGLSDGGCA